MNPYTIVALILAIAGITLGIVGYVKRHTAVQGIGLLIAMIAFALEVINQI